DREAFEAVGGFSPGYVYGVEDVDLCLELRRAGLRVLCGGRSVLLHHPVPTPRAAPLQEEPGREVAKPLLLWRRWGAPPRPALGLDGLNGGGIWAERDGLARASHPRPTLEEVEALGFCLKAATAGRTPGPPPAEVAVALRGRGHRCLVLEGEGVDDPIGLN